eukprot:jgi/Psemu1/20386/gm1.20386_g
MSRVSPRMRYPPRLHQANDRFVPVYYMSKIDLSDGFYWLWLRPKDTMPGEPPLIGTPLTNPIGWCSSLLNFCACTETIADQANAALSTPARVEAAKTTPHKLDKSHGPLQAAHQFLWTSPRKQMMVSADQAVTAAEPPVSLKKLHKGDAVWSTSDHVLGWLINSGERLQEIL